MALEEKVVGQTDAEATAGSQGRAGFPDQTVGLRVPSLQTPLTHTQPCSSPLAARPTLLSPHTLWLEIPLFKSMPRSYQFFFSVQWELL